MSTRLLYVHLSTMDEAAREKMKRKFDVAFVLAKNNLPMNKMRAICDLEERHGVDLGQGYKNNQACATFIEYIAMEQKQGLISTLSMVKFYSIQADGTTDTGNIENELFLIVYLDYNSSDGRVRVLNKFLTVRRPMSTDAEGLFNCLQHAVKYAGLSDDWYMKLVGFGCDGTSVNIGDRGLKMYLRRLSPWIEMFWCLAHRLELSLKDALKDTPFVAIDEMLLRVYYLYEKSPKKCRDLETVIEELQCCLTTEEFPTKGGHKPVRACGTRFIAHKVAALDRLIDRYGAYLNHLTALTEDSKTKPADRQRLKGYILKWRDAKMLLGSAYFCDLLKASSVLCKVLQEDVCVVRAIEALMKMSRQSDNLKVLSFEELPVVKKVLQRIGECDESSCVVYQEVQLTGYDRAITFYRNKHQDSEYIDLIQECLRHRIKTQIESTDLMTHTVTILATHGWERKSDPSFGYDALESIAVRFQVPLENAKVNCSELKGEWDDIVEYGKRYLNLVQEDYKIIWWKLFNVPDSSKWQNILAVVELLFCLPVSNGHLERVFSQLKLIKVDRRSSLGEDRLDQLVRINVEAAPLTDWDSGSAVDLWWKDKTRRISVSDSSRTTKNLPSDSNSSQLEDSFSLENWESWLQPHLED